MLQQAFLFLPSSDVKKYQQLSHSPLPSTYHSNYHLHLSQQLSFQLSASPLPSTYHYHQAFPLTIFRFHQQTSIFSYLNVSSYLRKTIYQSAIYGALPPSLSTNLEIFVAIILYHLLLPILTPRCQENLTSRALMWIRSSGCVLSRTRPASHIGHCTLGSESTNELRQSC